MSDADDTERAALRRIGWDHWDPIGLGALGPEIRQGPAADEYDAYLAHVAALLRAGASHEEAAAYLDGIARDDMCLGPGDAGRRAACARTVAAVAAYLEC